MSPDQAKELANEANSRLQEAYEKILPLWKAIFEKEAELNRRLSIPCFLDVQPQYFAAASRIVFVGQETHGGGLNGTGRSVVNCSGDHRLLPKRATGASPKIPLTVLAGRMQGVHAPCRYRTRVFHCLYQYLSV